MKALWSVAAAALAACGGDLTPSAGAGAGDPAAASTGDFLYYGGRVVSNQQVQPVFWGSKVNSGITGGIEAFYKAVLSAKSEYWAWLTEYDTKGVKPVGGGKGSGQTIGFGTVLKPVAIVPSFKGAAIDDTDIQAELKSQIKAGHLPRPKADAGGNDDTYYAVFFPQGVTVTRGGEGSCSVFCAYHGTIAADSSAGTPEFYYGVHMDLYPGSPCNGKCGGDTEPFHNQTAWASDELAETATDAEVGLSVSIGPPLAWYDVDSGEIGDMCASQQGPLPGTAYVVHKLWSNEMGECIISK